MEKEVGPVSSVRLYEAQASLLQSAIDLNAVTNEVVLLVKTNPEDVEPKLNDISEIVGRLVEAGLDMSNLEEGKSSRVEIVKVLSSVIMKSRRLTAATKTYVRNRAAVDVETEHLLRAVSDFKEGIEKLTDLCNALAASQKTDDALQSLEGLIDIPPQEEDETDALRPDSVPTHLMPDATVPSASDALVKPDEEKLSSQVDELGRMMKEFYLMPISSQPSATEAKSTTDDLEERLKMAVVAACWKHANFRRMLSVRGSIHFRADDSDDLRCVTLTETLFRDKLPGKRSTGDGAVSGIQKYFRAGESGTSESSDDDKDEETDAGKKTTSPGIEPPRSLSPYTKICSDSPPEVPVLMKAGKHVTFDLSGPSLSDDDESDDESAARNAVFVFGGGSRGMTDSTCGPSENQHGRTDEASAPFPPPRIRQDGFLRAGSSPRDPSTGRDGSEGGVPPGNRPPPIHLSMRAGGMNFTQTISFPTTTNGLVLTQTISSDPPTADAS